jgi:hypothetical protein
LASGSLYLPFRFRLGSPDLRVFRKKDPKISG